MLKGKIAAVEAQMKARLDELRLTFGHAGDKGVTIEAVFRKFLREYLPRRLGIGLGEVVDSKEHWSNQTDIVIANEDHPLTFTQNLPGLFFVEGVCGAGEIKTILTSEELEKAIDNSFCFKQLEMELGHNTIICSSPSDTKRFYKCPPYFLVALGSQLKLTTILEKIGGFMKLKGLGVNDINTILDAIFVIDRGWAINFGDGKGCFQLVTREGGVPTEGWAWKNSSTVLFTLLGWLSSVMPRMIRVEPILPLYVLPH